MSKNEPKPIKSMTQLFPCPHHVFCDIFNCRAVAKWFVGRPDGPLQCTFKLCPACAKSLVNMSPAELVDADFVQQASADAFRQEIVAAVRAEYEKRIADQLAIIENLQFGQFNPTSAATAKPATKKSTPAAAPVKRMTPQERLNKRRGK